MLFRRLLSGVAFFAVFYAVIWCDIRFETGWFLAGSMAIFCTWALKEFYQLARVHGWQPFSKFCYICNIVFFLGYEYWCQQKWHTAEPQFQGGDLTILTFTILGIFLLQITRKDQKGAMGSIASSLLGLCYCWFLISFLIRIRHLDFPGTTIGWGYDGAEAVFLAVLTAKASDVGGLIIGNKFGKHKLCPSLSPKKTWEGVFGGIILAICVLSSFALSEPLGTIRSIGWIKIVGFAVLMAVSSLMGDLVESALKRDAEVKDAGKAIPGFGGVLDLLDSLMVSAPAAYFYFVFVCGAKPGSSIY